VRCSREGFGQVQRNGEWVGLNGRQRDLVLKEVERVVTERGEKVGDIWSPFSESLEFWKEKIGFSKGMWDGGVRKFRFLRKGMGNVWDCGGDNVGFV
jgi:hypothetical protein